MDLAAIETAIQGTWLEEVRVGKVKRLGDGNVCHTGERTCFNKTLAQHEETIQHEGH